MADGLLSDSRHHRLHDRARRGVDRVEPVRSPRLLRARLRARVVVADSEDDRRARHRRRARAHHAGHDLRLRLQSSEHLRHAGDLRVAAVPAADHREGIAGAVSGARLAPAARRPPVRRSPASRSRRHSAALARARVRRAVAASSTRKGTRSPDGHVARFKAGSFLLAIEAGLPIVPLAVIGTRAGHAEGAAAHRAGRRPADRPRSDSAAGDRRADDAATRRRSPIASTRSLRTPSIHCRIAGSIAERQDRRREGDRDVARSFSAVVLCRSCRPVCNPFCNLQFCNSAI